MEEKTKIVDRRTYNEFHVFDNEDGLLDTYTCVIQGFMRLLEELNKGVYVNTVEYVLSYLRENIKEYEVEEIRREIAD